MPYYVYVVGLNPSVWDEKKKFRDENPGYIKGKPCVYVGQSAKTPEERYKVHKSGVREGSTWVYKYGEGLRPRKYKKYNPIATREESEIMEKELAEKLRKKRYGVWFR